MKTRLTFAAIIAATLLTACGGGGGGGGGGSTASPGAGGTACTGKNQPQSCHTYRSPPPNTAPSGLTPTTSTSFKTCTDGSVVTQSATCPSSTRSPVAVSQKATIGTVDPFYRTGGEFDINTGETNSILNFAADEVLLADDGIPFFHRRLEGPIDGDSSLEIEPPPLAVRQAWHDGWTGQGVNILIADDIGVSGRPPSAINDERGTHGYTVGLSAGQVAPRANFFGLNVGVADSDTGFGSGGIRNENNQIVAVATSFGVVNFSFGFNPEININEARRRVLTYLDDSRFQALAGLHTYTGLRDAVITKAAGNENADAGRVVGNLALVSSADTRDRVLIVGALNDWGASGARLDTRYSNFAGQTVAIRNRFLVEYGGSPYTENSFLCDASGAVNTCRNPQLLGGSGAAGTSFAAPRVSGYAALVRHKFPNLNAAQTASLLLDTATHDGLVGCAGGATSANFQTCERRYGQGRVDIGAALSPQGGVE